MATTPQIAAVIWDLGGVILKTEDTSHREKWEKRFDLEPWGLEKLVFGNPISQSASKGNASIEDIWDYVQSKLGMEDEEMDAFRKDFFAGDEVDLELMAFIRQIKTKFKSGMITNAWPGMRHFIEQEWDIADAFEDIVVSAEIHLVKPDPEIYELALDQLKVPAQEAVFIDDFIENIEGAENVGMTGIHFRSTAEVMEKLRAKLKVDF
jgi:epoxide hydrolase-like predicted phosphatase